MSEPFTNEIEQFLEEPGTIDDNAITGILRAYTAKKRALEDLNKLYQEEIARLSRELAQHTEPIKQYLERIKLTLKNWHEANNIKSRQYPTGKVTIAKSPTKVVYKQEDLILNYFKETGEEDLIRTTETLNKPEIKKRLIINYERDPQGIASHRFVTKNGEILDFERLGIEIQDQSTTIRIIQ